MRTYGFNRVEMSRNLTLEQLIELEEKVKLDHKLEQNSGIHIYDRKGMKKLDDIGWAIYHKTKGMPR
ncbi:MAG: hypothetical protein J6O49_05160 [Bacteroidaceae bacterium]|nr:hypothetical protein [Bacteroidaceae bacterium]